MSLVVLGTGTGVGKTVTSAVILARYGKSIRMGYWKPVQTGSTEGTDSAFIRRVCGHLVDVLPEAYVFQRPLSPHLAARLEKAEVRIDRILEGLVAHGLEDCERSLIVEGIGGVLVPLDERGYLFADLCKEFHLPCLVAAQSTLGTINHTLLTLEALRARRIEVAGVVLCGPKNPENRKAIERFGKVEVISVIAPIRPMGRAGILRAARGFDRKARLKEYLL